MWRNLIQFFKLLPIAIILGVHLLGFLGHLHPLFDTFANLRLFTSLILMVLTIMLIFGGHGLWGMVALAAAAVGVVSFGYEFPAISPPKGNFKVVQVDLGSGPRKLAFLTALLADERPDLVALLSLDVTDSALLDAAKGDFPHQLVCNGVKGEIALLSRAPVTDGACSASRGYGHFRLNRNGKVLKFGLVQLPYPYPDPQWQHLRAIEPELRDGKDPIILAVGLSAIPWAAAAQRIADATRTRPVSGPKLTYQIGKIPALPLAQIYADHSFGIANVRVGADIGSTHLPLIAELVW